MALFSQQQVERNNHQAPIQSSSMTEPRDPRAARLCLALLVMSALAGTHLSLKSEQDERFATALPLTRRPTALRSLRDSISTDRSLKDITGTTEADAAGYAGGEGTGIVTVGDGGSGNAAGEAYSLALGESNSWVTSNYGSIRTNAGAGGFGGGGGGIDVVGDGGTNTAVSTGRSRGGAMALGFGNFEGLVFGGNRNQAVVEGKGDKHQQRNENSNKNKGKNQDDEDETEEEDLGPSGVMDYAAAGGSAAGYGESVGAGQGIDVGIGVTEAVSVGESGGYAISNSIVDAGNEGAQGGARGEGFGSSGGSGGTIGGGDWSFLGEGGGESGGGGLGVVGVSAFLRQIKPVDLSTLPTLPPISYSP